ncbi:hypothetical protein I315_01794 [Cryptococcus gattii Ru294]|nr:hypothetical protein I315_01794 [Cryptococcus gattii Ru294]
MSKQWSVLIAYGPKSVMGFERVGKGILFLYPAPSVFVVSSNLCRGTVYLKMTSVKDKEEEEDRLNETKPVIGVDSNAAGSPLRVPILVP